MTKKLLLLFFLLSTTQLSAQNFSIIDTLVSGAYGTAEWGDFDNDGYMDLVYISQVLPTAACKIYHNQNNVFTEVTQQFPLLYNPAAKWADFDNDGFQDLIVCGLNDAFEVKTFIYQSLGNGSFTSISHTIPGLSVGNIDVADYNNDSLMDIAISGYTNGGPMAFIFKNLGAFQFSDIGAPLIGIHRGELRWGDYDHNGFPDLVVTGDESPGVQLRFYRNMGSDIFEEELFHFPGTAGTVDWIDFDLDGIDDLFITGTDSSFTHNVTALYKNDGLGNFTLIPTNIPDFGEPSAVDIADFNNDSIQDICLVGGNTIFNSYSVIAYGQGSSTFVFQPLPPALIDNLFVDAADIDSDGDMDLVMSTFILRNDGTATSLTDTDRSENNVLMYPNPARSTFSILSHRKFYSYEIYDLLGNMIKKSLSADRYEQVNIATLPSGLYSIKVFFEDGQFMLKKFSVMN